MALPFKAAPKSNQSAQHPDAAVSPAGGRGEAAKRPDRLRVLRLGASGLVEGLKRA